MQEPRYRTEGLVEVPVHHNTALRALHLRTRRAFMADHEHQPDAARRMRNLLDVTRVTENLGADLMPADCVVSYTHALDDMMDAMQCKFAIADLEWIWDKRAEGYPRHTEQQRLQAE